MIEYPEALYCPRCNEKLQLDVNGNNLSSSDILSLNIEIPYSQLPVKDAKRHKQDIGYYSHIFVICTKCSGILGLIPGMLFRD